MKTAVKLATGLFLAIYMCALILIVLGFTLFWINSQLVPAVIAWLVAP